MAEAIVSTLSEKLTSLLADKIFQEVSLVINFREDVESICDELDSFKTVLNNVRELTNSSSTTNWLHKVQDFLYRAMDIVEECEVRKFRNPFFRYRMGRRIKTLKKSISNIHSSAKHLKYLKSVVDANAHFHSLYANTEDKSKKSIALLTESRTVGMKKEIDLITNWVLQDGFTVIAVVGTGGMGKTLVLQNVLSKQTVRQRFDHVIWLAVSQKYIVKELLLEMCRQIKVPSDSEDLSGLAEDKLKQIIHKHLANKCCLLVLDDVWEEISLEQIGFELQSGDDKIIVSTRDKRVGDAMKARETHEMKYLTTAESLELFNLHAFPGQNPPHELVSDRENHPPSEEMKLISERIVQKCEGSRKDP